MDFLTDCSNSPEETVARHLVHLLSVKEKADYMVQFIDKLEKYSVNTPSYSPLETADPEVSKKLDCIYVKLIKSSFAHNVRE